MPQNQGEKTGERPFDAAIFDMDGTLLDSMGVWADVDRAFLTRRGLPVAQDYIDALTAMSFPEAAAYTIARYDLQETPEALYAEWKELSREAYACHVVLKPGVRDYLLRLQAQGIRLAVATAATPDLYEPALARNGVLGLFDTICTTQEAGAGKDSPAVFLLAARRLGIQPARCAVFEDVYRGIASAKEAGMLAYGIYDPSSAASADAIRRQADGYFTSFAFPMPGDV